MTEIANKIESIRNMKEDLNSIKIVSQKNTEKMFQDLADFRNRICHQMSKIENIYQTGRIHRGEETRKMDQSIENLTVNSDSDCNASQVHDSNADSVQKESKQMLIELQNYSEPEPVTDLSTSLSNMHIGYQNKENYISSTDTLASISTPDPVNIIFSKQLPYVSSEAKQTNKEVRSISSASGQIKNPSSNENSFENTNDALTKDKIDKLTKKLKEIQTQNDELRNVNENIQILLVKLNDLKYVDAETVDKLETRKESQMSDLSYLPQINSETLLNNDNYRKLMQSVRITSKCKTGCFYWLFLYSYFSRNHFRQRSGEYDY